MNWISNYYRSTIGKKFIMAVTGIILFGFVVVHMVGNLQVYSGPEKLNHYAKLLRISMPLLWGFRLVMFTSVTLHIIAAVQVWLRNRAARPIDYRVKADLGVDYAARTMIWSGPIIGAFVVYHLLHFTFGTVHPDFIDGDVYHNVITGFQQLPASIFYIIANILLGLHLYHGMWSLFQTLGLEHPKLNPWRRVFATFFAIIITAGNVSIPVAVLTGIVY